MFHGILSILVDEDMRSDRTHKNNAVDLERQKTTVIDKAKGRPVVIAIDTLERYSIYNTSLLKAIAALIQFAKSFNTLYSRNNFHIKILMSGEIFPHLSRHLLENPLKSVRSTVFLIWKPKPLLRLIGYRFFRYLEHHDLLNSKISPSVNWNSYDDVLEKVWNPYFGSYVTNSRGVQESSFP